MVGEDHFKPRPFKGTISYFQGDGDRLRDPRPFWQELADDGLEIHEVTGEMNSIFVPPNVNVLASELRESLSRPTSPDYSWGTLPACRSPEFPHIGKSYGLLT